MSAPVFREALNKCHFEVPREILRRDETN